MLIYPLLMFLVVGCTTTNRSPDPGECIEAICVLGEEAESLTERTLKMYQNAGYREPVFIPEFDYPPELQRMGIEGTVVVEFNVDASGNVFAPKVLTQNIHPIMKLHAINYIERIRFKASDKVSVGQKQRLSYELR